VLNEKGDFVGFDVVIGNPPYGTITSGMDYFTNKYVTVEGRFDLFEAFIERGLAITLSSGLVKYILPNTLLTNLYSQKVRRNLIFKQARIDSNQTANMVKRRIKF
jgi:tRNA1(Val) A37 N6-methylase TrmN6